VRRKERRKRRLIKEALRLEREAEEKLALLKEIKKINITLRPTEAEKKAVVFEVADEDKEEEAY
jgi:hypothetical protein